MRGVLVICVGFLPVLAIATMTASMPVMLDHFSDWDNARFLVPLLVTAPGLMIALLGMFAGAFVDRFGRRRPLVAACILYGVAGCLPLVLDHLYAIIASRLLLGIAEAGLITISATLIADYWDDAGRRFWLTVQGVTGPFLSSAVIAASGHLADIRWNAVFLLYLAAFPLAWGCSRFLHDVPLTQAARRSGTSAVGKWLTPYAPVLALTMFTASLYYVWIVQGGLAFREIGITSPARQGQIFALAHLGVVLGALVFWGAGRWLGSAGLAALMLGLMGLGLTLLGGAETESEIILGLVVQQAAAGMSVPTMMQWAQRVLPEAVRGKGLGLWAAAFFAGQFLSPAVFAATGVVDSGVLARFALFGWAGMFTSAALCIFAIGGAIKGKRRAA